MPLMMNDDMELDINDLFDDGTGLSLPSRPPPKELFQRVDELRGSGCCQGVAWSRWGCIASIRQDGVGLEFRNLRCHPLDGSWDLSEPTATPPIIPNLDGGSLQHLCWSPNGSDLAAIDVAGRISILSVGTFLNKPTLIRSCQTEPAEDLNAVVGAYWLNLLPIPRLPIINSLAVKTEKDYRYEMAQPICFGPCHPQPQKSALVCLTTNGDLKLLWPQADGKWYESISEIESVVSSNDLITHASICADKNHTLLVAFATTTKQLRIVRVAIQWGNKPNEKANPSGTQITVNPSMLIYHLAVTNWMDGSSIDGLDSSHIQSSMITLSHLEILPQTPDGPGGQQTRPTIMTVRSHLPTSPSHFNQDIHSTIDRWELRESAQPIHPAFEQLGSRRRSAGSHPANAISLKKLDSLTVNKVVIYVQAVALDRIICFAYSDGSFEYRDRMSLAETFTDGSLERFTHLSQIGFSYNDDEPSLQLALSPTNCSFVQIGCDGKLKWRSLRHHLDQNGTSIDDAQYAAIVAGFTIVGSAAIMSSINYDDVLAIAHRFTTQPTFSHDWLSGVSRVCKFYVDYSEESHHDTLIRNSPIQLCLSIQNSLGYNGDGQSRAFGAKIAWISLQIRNCVVLMTMAASMKVQEGPQKTISGLEDAEAIRILSGSVRWCLDLIAWLIDSLLHPEDTSIFKSSSTGQSIDLESLNSRLHASNNVALHLLLSSAARGFLTVICRRLAHLDYTARKAMSTVAQSQTVAPTHLPQPLTSNTLRAAYTTIATLTSGSIIQIRTFETFLTSISASVKDAYTSAGLPSSASQSQPQQQPHTRPTDTKRNTVEQTMLFGGPLPAALVPTMRHIFTSLLPTLRSSIDPAKLFFHDFSLLALDPFSPPSTVSPPRTPPDDSFGTLLSPSRQEGKRSSADERVAHTIDIFRRVPVVLGLGPGDVAINEAGTGEKGRDGRRWRRCVRCAAVMEDLQSNKTAVHFLIMQQRRCFCGGSWDIISGKKVVA